MHPLLRTRTTFLALAAAALLAVPGLAQARVYWNVGVGFPVYYGSSWSSGWGGGWYDLYPAYGGWYGGWPGWSPPVVVEREPVVVQSFPPGPAPQSFWYYCQNPAGYYPYVSVCPGGWTPVPSTPPPPPPPAPAK